MAVWRIAAGGLNDPAALENYGKTLSSNISKKRLSRLPAGISLPEGELYAWGFPRTAKGGNESKVHDISVGDLCFFCATDVSGPKQSWVNKYLWVARVSGKVDKNHFEGVSEALWDSKDFYPYWLSKPVSIDVGLQEFGWEIDPDGVYYGSSPQSSSRLNDPNKLKSILEKFGSVDAWGDDYFIRLSNRFETEVEATDRASYREKIPALREWLVRVSKARETVTFEQVMDAFGVDRFSLRHAMDQLGSYSAEHGEPIITALIVSADNKKCSEDLYKEFGVLDEELERKRLYEFWSSVVEKDKNSLAEECKKLDAKAARFASIEVRPDQAAFRRKVYLAFGGKCVITGCGIRQALDAAHIAGRSWRLGHNDGKDGLLLRKDLHALYDAGLLQISDSGVVTISESLSDHYGSLSGVVIKQRGEV